MSSGERPIGAAKGKQSDTEALCQPPPPRGAHWSRGEGRRKGYETWALYQKWQAHGVSEDTLVTRTAHGRFSCPIWGSNSIAPGRA